MGLFNRTQSIEPYLRDRSIEGVDFKMSIADSDARAWYDTGTADPDWPEVRFIRDHMIRPGDTVFDCGAHQGATAIIFANWTGAAGRVIAFEPVAANRQRIAQNLELNGIRNVTIEATALGGKTGHARLRSGTNAALSSWPLLGERVQVRQLDEFANLEPAFIKIDVEGSEIAVLRGAQVILQRAPGLAIEIHAQQLKRHGQDPRDVLRLIDTSRYDLWVQEDAEQYPYRTDNVTYSSPIIHVFCVPA